jgi:4-hydroxy-2-oxoheptanedioate aldolase
VRQNRTLAKIREGRAAVGLWLQSGSLHLARLLAASGTVDWLLVDFEHAPVDLSAAAAIFAAIADASGGRCTPLARVASNERHRITRALDAGAHGVVVPMVSSAEEAAAAVRSARYPPEGERGAGGLGPHLGFGTLDHGEYVRGANQEILVAVQVETRAAVERVDAIAAVPGVDLIFVGPYDLHLALGLPPGLWSELAPFRAAIDQVIAACRAHGRPLGTLSPDAAGAARRFAEGFTLLGVGSDVGHLSGAVAASVGQLRAQIEPTGGAPP